MDNIIQAVRQVHNMKLAEWKLSKYKLQCVLHNFGEIHAKYVNIFEEICRTYVTRQLILLEVFEK